MRLAYVYYGTSHHDTCVLARYTDHITQVVPYYHAPYAILLATTNNNSICMLYNNLNSR